MPFTSCCLARLCTRLLLPGALVYRTAINACAPRKQVLVAPVWLGISIKAHSSLPVTGRFEASLGINHNEDSKMEGLSRSGSHILAQFESCDVESLTARWLVALELSNGA